MGDTAEFIDSKSRVNVLWFLYIGNPLAIVINIVLLFQLLYAYCKKFKSKTNDGSKSKVPYIMVIMYLLVSLIACTGYAFVFTSFSTNITRLRCQLAWIMIYIFSAIAFTILDLIFLHRIYVIFKDSAYEYKSWLYKSLFVLIMFGPMLTATPIFVSVIIWPDTLSIQYDPATNLTVCSATNGEQLSPTRLSVGLTVIVIQTSILVALLFMFIRGLWSLNKQLMKHFLDDHVRGNSNEFPAQTPDTTEMVTSTSSVLDNWGKQRTVAREQLRPEVQRIMTLHNLIKKQTILVCISAVSTCVLSGTAIIDISAGMGLGWDVVINSMCIWMMLDTSKKYWTMCKNYGVCFCCYWRANKLGV